MSIVADIPEVSTRRVKRLRRTPEEARRLILQTAQSQAHSDRELWAGFFEYLFEEGGRLRLAKGVSQADLVLDFALHILFKAFECGTPTG